MVTIVVRFCFVEPWIVERSNNRDCHRSCYIWNGGYWVGDVWGLLASPAFRSCASADQTM